MAFLDLAGYTRLTEERGDEAAAELATDLSRLVFMVGKAFLKPASAAPPAPTKTCPECMEVVPKAARKCRACASPLPA